MRQAFIGIDVGTSSARAGVFDENGTLLATARHPITVWHEAGSVVEQSSSEIWAACATSVRAAMAEAAHSAFRGQGRGFRCDLLARGARRRRPSADGQQLRRRTAECHRLDGPSRDGRSPPGQRDAGRRAPLCRRLDLAGNGNSKTALAEAASAVDLSVGRSFLRPRRLSFVSRHRIDRALDMHAGLQMELSRPRTTLERQLFRARRSWRPCLGQICENRQRRSSHPARRSAPV